MGNIGRILIDRPLWSILNRNSERPEVAVSTLSDLGHVDRVRDGRVLSEVSLTAGAPVAGVHTTKPACGELFSRPPGLPASA